MVAAVIAGESDADLNFVGSGIVASGECGHRLFEYISARKFADIIF